MRGAAWWRGRWRVGWRGVAICGVGALCVAAGASAQQGEASGQPVGAVSGRVMAQDTQRPVRLASVSLQTVASVAAAASGDGSRTGSGSSSQFTRTDVDGNFLAAGVAPGDYYVTATATGYVPERALLQTAVEAGADPAALLAQLPMVHVAAGETSPVTVTIERSGTIAGKVQWEDGSPAVGVNVSAVAPTGAVSAFGPLPGALQGLQTAGGPQAAMTDDRGVYRLTGLATGTYLVRSVVQGSVQTVGMGGLPGRAAMTVVRVYAPGVFRRAAAKTVEVKAGEERSDVAMTIDLRGLHTVSGNLSSANAGQSVASGRIVLADANDGELQLNGAIAADGSFTVRYVPSGSYTLKVVGASSEVATGRRRGESGGSGIAYQPYTQALTVNDTDVSGMGITLTPVASQP